MIAGQSGVVVPASQRRELERTEPNKLINIIPANVFAVQYGDGTGNVIKEFWYEVGGVFYQPQGSEQFAQGLREVKETFVKQARAKLAQRDLNPNDVPTADVVDVISRQTAEEAESGVDV